MKANYLARLGIVVIVSMMIVLAGEYLHATDEETASDSLQDYSIEITMPASSPAYFPFGTPIGAPVELDAQVNPEPVNGGTITWDFNEQGTMGVGSWYFNAAKPIVYLFTALFNKDGKTVPSQPVIIGFPKVEIDDPKGSYVETSPYDTTRHMNFPADSVTRYPLRYDFQGVVSGCINSLPIDIYGIVEDNPPFKSKWTLDESAGYFLDESDQNSPSHVEPETPGVGVLKLTALDSSNLDANGEFIDTEVSDGRTLIVYRDHLERDFENFNGHHWGFMYMGDSNEPFSTGLNCWSSVMHSYDGTSGPPYTYRNWKNKVYDAQNLPTCIEFVNDVQGNDGADPLTLERGDVIGYFREGVSGIEFHSSTMLDSYWSWGSNNLPPAPWYEGEKGNFKKIAPEEYCTLTEMYSRTNPGIVFVQVFRKPE